MKINAVELERQIDNGFENVESLITDMFEFIEGLVHSVETGNKEQLDELVEQWRSDEDTDADDDLDDDDLDDVDFDDDDD